MNRELTSSAEEQEQFKSVLESACPNAEIYFIDGGQDIYPYIFVAE